MNSTKLKRHQIYELAVWEICKFWILQNILIITPLYIQFERYVNFEFYKTEVQPKAPTRLFERYVNFEFYKTELNSVNTKSSFERYVNFEFYKTIGLVLEQFYQFERYVNFEFYKTYWQKIKLVLQVWEICKFWILQNI